jgi:hypothetical protein
MFFLLNGQNLNHINAPDVLTPLEHALLAFRHIDNLITEGARKDAVLVETLIREQAVLVCCSQGQFVLGQHVYNRLWLNSNNSLEKDVKKWLHKVITLRLSPTDINTKSPFINLLTAARSLLSATSSQLPDSYLLQLALAQPNSIELSSTNVILSADSLTKIAQRIGSCGGSSAGSDVSFKKDVCSILSSDQHQQQFVVQLEAARRTKLWDSQSILTDDKVISGASLLTINSYSSDIDANTDVAVPIKTKHRKSRRAWTAAEEEKVYVAVQKYGIGHWSQLVKHRTVPHRSSIDIKDKWRTMLKNGRLDQLSTQFGPLRPKTC